MFGNLALLQGTNEWKFQGLLHILQIRGIITQITYYRDYYPYYILHWLFPILHIKGIIAHITYYREYFLCYILQGLLPMLHIRGIITHITYLRIIPKLPTGCPKKCSQDFCVKNGQSLLNMHCINLGQKRDPLNYRGGSEIQQICFVLRNSK